MSAVTIKYVRPPGLKFSQWETLSGRARAAMQRFTPVDTGRLRSSWQELGSTSRSITLRATEDYASFVNNGESRYPLSAKQIANIGFTDRAKTSLNVLAGRMLAKDVDLNQS